MNTDMEIAEIKTLELSPESGCRLFRGLSESIQRSILDLKETVEQLVKAGSIKKSMLQLIIQFKFEDKKLEATKFEAELKNAKRMLINFR